ncbi:molybdate ABC transporter substrate-binding protein [Crocosphaera watsonii WH 8501]|uniref:Molybdenum ABC transporter, periplasmic binding protein n=3 Tax=Crocosphaera watsonii TaxID=263511 RepID=Q4BYP5_CROWT|nr:MULTISPECIES: molybdate ABC transporter substrate-binding protein [Crocosphaera]EAM49026.1 Molybdenum ABC transporter, periplasmic binding protein [Crocosphaera watsonii WH 8501]MCH2244246.1 molybdate ABC transporter substrate-binding protein [Crocosphaera sp.]NQZ63416.1 molybdate ABC transporter substrate-binding protein [Crocosphaera sp.]
MKRKHFLALTLASFVTACTSSNPNPKAPSKVTLTISVAASLQDVMKAVKNIYQLENPNLEIIYNFGSSGSLQQQIEQGAPTDVFISAAPKQMNVLEKRGLLLTQTRQNLLTNNLVLITPKDSTTSVTFETLSTADLEKIALGDPDSVPAGQYGKQVFNSLKAYDKLTPKLVYGKSVRQVLFYVETGNVDAGIVYATDATISSKVKVTDTAPEDSHSPIIYPIAVIKESKKTEESQKFIDFLLSEKGQSVFADYGFTKPEN